MAISVLVADPNLEFAESVRHILEGTGRYVVLLAKNGAEAITVAGSRPVRLAIVNAVLPDLGSAHVVRQLRMLCPGLSVIAIPSKTGTEDSDMMTAGVDEFLPHLVYLPDLPKIVESVLLGEEGEMLGSLRSSDVLPPPAPPTEPGLKVPKWLLDQERATDYLARLIGMSAAIASVLTLGNRLWAAVGSLTPAQFDELTLLVAGTSASSPGRGALARFVRLTGASTHFQLYSTEVVGELLLSMVFPANIPFGQVRLVARDVAAALATIDPGDQTREHKAEQAEAGSEIEPAAEEAPPVVLPRDWVPKEPTQLKILPFLAPTEPAPPETPSAPPRGNGKPLPPPDLIEMPRDWLPRKALSVSQLPFIVPPEAEVHAPPPISHDAPSHADDSLWIEYSIVFVPRLPDHRLSGSLAEDLAKWTKRFCLAWDWRLEQFQLSPTHLSLTLSLPPEVAPASAARLLLDSLSSQVGHSFPEIAGDLPSGQFWARSYFLVAGTIPADRVADFIRRTRHAQGLQT
jgi:CheY-like chemotaxis protein/REP element-mobilizing transposase RayT